jgi:hypothetical protein
VAGWYACQQAQRVVAVPWVFDFAGNDSHQQGYVIDRSNNCYSRVHVACGSETGLGIPAGNTAQNLKGIPTRGS